MSRAKILFNSFKDNLGVKQVCFWRETKARD